MREINSWAFSAVTLANIPFRSGDARKFGPQHDFDIRYCSVVRCLLMKGMFLASTVTGMLFISHADCLGYFPGFGQDRKCCQVSH